MSDYIVWKNDSRSLLVELLNYDMRRIAQVQEEFIKKGYYVRELVDTNTSLFIRFEKVVEVETNVEEN